MLKNINLLLILCGAAVGQTTFPWNSPGVTYGGYGLWSDGGGFQFQTQGAGSGCGGYNAYSATGTALAEKIWQSSGTSWFVSVDGGPLTAVSTTGAGVFDYSTLFTGLPATTHSVYLTGYGGGTPISNTATFMVIGPAPAISANPDFANPLYFASTPWTMEGVLGGAPSNDNLCPGTKLWAATNSYNTAGGDAEIRFSGNPTSIWLWGPHFSSVGANVYNVYQDGTLITQFNSLSTQPGGIWLDQIASGLSGTHLYSVRNVAFDGKLFATGIVLPGATTINTLTPYSQTWLVYGDSIIEGVSAAVSDSSLLFPFEMGVSAGVGIRRNGIAGYTNLQLSNAAYINSLMNDATPLFSHVVYEGGLNDAGQSVPIAGNCTTNPSFEYNALLALNNIATDMATGGTLYWEQITPQNFITVALRAAYNAAEITATGCYNASKINGVTVVSVPTDNWIDGSVGSADLNGAAHPNGSGNAKIANNWVPIISANTLGYSYTLTGPSSGAVGVPSTPFTVSLANGATFTGFQTVTCSDGGAGGTFSPSQPMTPASGNTATFTYTPLAAGTPNISCVNGKIGWLNPSPVLYTVSGGSAPATPTEFTFAFPFSTGYPISWSGGWPSASGGVGYNYFSIAANQTGSLYLQWAVPHGFNPATSSFYLVFEGQGVGNDTITLTATTGYFPATGSLLTFNPSPVTVSQVTSGLTNYTFTSPALPITGLAADAPVVFQIQALTSGQFYMLESIKVYMTP